MCQAEAIIACAPVISRDVDALVDATTVVFRCTLVDICGEKIHEDVRAGPSKRYTIKIQSGVRS